MQKSYHEVDVNIVEDKDTDKQDVNKMVKLIKKVLGVKKVNIAYLDSYPIEKSGKKIAFKCMIKDENIIASNIDKNPTTNFKLKIFSK